MIKLDIMLNSLIYSVLGVVVFGVAFVVIDLLSPYNLWKEIIEEKNLALGTLVGGIAIGICIIIAAAIH